MKIIKSIVLAALALCSVQLNAAAPAGTIYNILETVPQLSHYRAIVDIGMGDIFFDSTTGKQFAPATLTALQKAVPMTLFAPNNTAIETKYPQFKGKDYAGALAEAKKIGGPLRDFVKLHTVIGKGYYTAAGFATADILTANLAIKAYLGNTITVVEAGKKIKGHKNTPAIATGNYEGLVGIGAGETVKSTLHIIDAVIDDEA